MNQYLFNHKKRDVVQYILVLTVIAIILAYAFPKIRDKMGVTTKSTASNIDVGMGNMFSNSQPNDNPPVQCLPTVDIDISQSSKQSLINNYNYVYAVDVKVLGGYGSAAMLNKKVRAYVYSNSPLTFNITNDGYADFLNFSHSSDSYSWWKTIGEVDWAQTTWKDYVVVGVNYDNLQIANGTGQFLNWQLMTQANIGGVNGC